MALPSDKEMKLISEFRGKLTDLCLDDEKKSDMYLVRFLRARDLNMNKANEMFRKHIEWVRKNDIDKIFSWQAPKFLIDEYPYEQCGVDCEGCPVMVAPFGVWDTRKACEIGEKPNYVKYVDQLFMKLLKSMTVSSNNNQVPVTQFVAIFIPDGLQAFRQMSSIQAVDAVLETVRRFESNHPERLKAAFVIDAPRAFSIIFNAIRPLLNSHTMGKVTIASHENDWKPKLLKLVDPSQLPKRLGGTAISTIDFLNEERGGVERYLQRRKLSGNLEKYEDESSYEHVKVEAGKQFKIEYDVEEPGSSITWTFKTDGYDIGYSVIFEDKTEIVPYERFGAQKEAQTGATLCKQCGKYTVIFDNTYSRLRSKMLMYKVALLEAVNNFDGQYQSTFL